MRRLGVYRVPFTQTQMNEIRRMGEAEGFEVVFMDEPRLTGDWEILLGYFPPEEVVQCHGLKWLQLPSAGVEKWLGRLPQGAVLTNGSGAFGRAIAEHVMLSALMLLRRTRQYEHQQREKLWRNAGEIGFIAGSQVTVIGLGDIGTHVAAYCKAMGAQVTGVRRTGGEMPTCVDRLLGPEQLNMAVAQADLVVACLPYTAHTHEIIDKSVLDAMPATAHFINVGRGKTVDETALIQALQSGRLAGAALDVTQVEPLPQDSPLWEMENVILTPHMSGHDDDTLNAQGIFEIFKGNFGLYCRGEGLNNVVNPKIGY